MYSKYKVTLKGEVSGEKVTLVNHHPQLNGKQKQYQIDHNLSLLSVAEP